MDFRIETMYFLLKMGDIPASYVCLPEGIISEQLNYIYIKILRFDSFFVVVSEKYPKYEMMYLIY